MSCNDVIIRESFFVRERKADFIPLEGVTLVLSAEGILLFLHYVSSAFSRCVFDRLDFPILLF